MEKGTDVNELFTDLEPKKVEIIYNNKIWEFEIRDLTWSEKNQIISKSIIVKKNNSEPSFDANKYNQLALEKMVIKSPFEINKANILRINEKFGDLLIKTIVEKSEVIDSEKSGN